MKGFLCRKSSLFPKNSGPPKMKQLLGSNAFNLAVMCNSCSWLNNHVVAAMMSGWCRYISSTIIPTFSLMVADTISHFRNCFLLFVRAVQGVPTKSVHTSYWGLSREFSYLIEFHLCKDNWFCFRINKKGYICMSEIENSRVIGIECFLKDEIFFLYSYFYKVITGCLITGLIK